MTARRETITFGHDRQRTHLLTSGRFSPQDGPDARTDPSCNYIRLGGSQRTGGGRRVVGHGADGPFSLGGTGPPGWSAGPPDGSIDPSGAPEPDRAVEHARARAAVGLEADELVPTRVIDQRQEDGAAVRRPDPVAQRVLVEIRQELVHEPTRPPSDAIRPDPPVGDVDGHQVQRGPPRPGRRSL